jgi:drug/metabolite transporter (DMT)-like permease
MRLGFRLRPRRAEGSLALSLTVLALVAAAAFAHAGWNLVAKPAEGGAAFVWLCAVAGTLLYLPVLVVALVTDPGPLGWTALALMAVSGALHALYFVLLQRAYATGDLSVVYPLSRGTGPLLSATIAILVLGERPSLLALAGAALIVASVFSLIRRPEDGSAAIGSGTLFAVLTGAAIAAYTLWDKQAVDAVALSPVVYYWGTNLANAVVLAPVALRNRDDLRRAWTTSRLRAAGVGLLSPLAYVLVLYALVDAPVSSVAPARESSIVVGTLLGVLVLHEGDRRRRLAAAAAILAGVVLLALG